MVKKSYLLTILILFMIFISIGCNKQAFVGNSTSNASKFVMDYSILNCTKTHEMKLEKGAKINAVIESQSGSIDILVTDEDGKEIYKGDNASSGKFALNIPKTGTYKFSVTGSKAKGSVSFKVDEA